VSATTTYRGRSLDEVLPQVRDELGDDAVIEAHRDGRVGGFAGFFQRTMVEVDARPAEGDEGDAAAEAPAPRFDALAGAEDEEAVRAAAGPFAELLAGATAAPPQEDEDEPRFVADAPEPAPEREPLPPWALRDPEPEPEPAPAPGPAPAAPPAAPVLPAAAAGHERRLAAHGLSPALAAAVVRETVDHVLPFAAPRGLKRAVRASLARRLPVAPPSGPGPRVIALAGAAGAGRTRTAAGLAAAYATARPDGEAVTAVALRPADAGAELTALLAPHGVAVAVAADGAAARALLADRAAAPGAVAVLDAPAVSPRDPAAVAALAADLAAAGATETHVLLPATVSLPVAREVLAALAPLRPAGVVVTHADETDHLGPLVEVAIATGVPLSFLVGGADPADGITLADPSTLAARVLP
jgi:flagellar biosynthesis GTPase FlhF